MWILEWFGRRGAARGGDAPRTQAARITAHQVQELARHFPIGSRLSYYPEFRKTTRMDTIILGYEINGQGLFSNPEIHLRADEEGLGVVLRLGGREECLREVQRFDFMVPFSQRSELDYAGSPTGAEGRLVEKAVNDFRRGNTITLFNKGANGKVPHLHTTVARVAVLAGGVFQNQTVALLEPDVKSFHLLDQRQYHRIYTCIPAILAAAPETPGEGCVVQDFSERYVRVGPPEDERAPFLPSLKPGDRVVLTVVAQPRGQTFILRGSVHRRGPDHLVLALSSLWKNKRFHTLGLIDEFEFKTALLHHAEIQTESRDPGT